MSFRESSVVVIETGRLVLRAGRGLGDSLIPPPSVEIDACCGRRRDVTSADSPSSYLVGQPLAQARANGEDLELFWPFQDGDIADWTQAEALWKYILFSALQLTRDQNEFPVMLSVFPNLARSSWERITQMFFERFNVAAITIFERPLLQLLAANNLSGIVIDIGSRHTDIAPIFDCAVLRPGITSVPIGLLDCEMYLAHLLRTNTSVMSQLGSLSPADLQTSLLRLVRQARTSGLIQIPLAEGFTPSPSLNFTGVDEEGNFNIAAVMAAGKERAIVESRKKSSSAPKGRQTTTAAEKERIAQDLIDLEFTFKPGGEGSEGETTVNVTLGRERHQFCEPLFDPSLMIKVGRMSDPSGETARATGTERVTGLQEAVRRSIQTVDPERRMLIWDGVLLTGAGAGVKNLDSAVHHRLLPYLIRDPETALHVQPSAIRLLKIPEYFAEYRERSHELAAFLGACLVSKATFTDSSGKNFITKGDYAERGPAAIRDLL